MTALPLISHRLLVAAVAEQRGIHHPIPARKRPAVIECIGDLSVVCLDLEKSAAALPAMIVHHAPTPAVAVAAWPF